MKPKFLYLIIFISSFGNSQNLKTSDILKISDSLLLRNSNKNLFQFFELSDGSYYKYSQGKFERTGKFLSKKRLNKKTNEIWILYSFEYPKIDGIKGGTWVKLNEKLNLIEPIDLDFIPNFIWKNEESNFISKDSANKIAKQNFIKKGIKIDEPELMYDKKQNAYVYMIVNKLNEQKNSVNQPSGNTEVIKINAENGKIVEKFDGYYGLIIR